MKNKLILLVLSAFLCSASVAIKAQGNLQFNQVIDTSLSVLSTGTCVYTVPAGKVFKLETMSAANTNYDYSVYVYFNSGSCGSSTTGRGYYYVAYDSFEGLSNGNVAPWKIFPLWLKAGTNIYAVSAGSSAITIFNLDGIEYNIVP